jgi:hypothetical protein
VVEDTPDEEGERRLGGLVFEAWASGFLTWAVMARVSGASVRRLKPSSAAFMRMLVRPDMSRLSTRRRVPTASGWMCS